MLNTFKSGIHIADSKELSCKAPVSNCPAPKTVYIPLSQHLGKDALPVVEKDAVVKAGQVIAKADGLISADIFSPICGVVKEISDRATATGECKHIVIEANDLQETFSFPPLNNPKSEEIVTRLKECGIVGMGGAGFPTAVKLSPKDKIDTFIINGAECEPYITCDYRIMMDYTEQFIRGAALLAKAAKVETCTIAIEENKQDAIDKINTFLINNTSFNVKVVAVKTKYPQGAEKQLIYAVTQRKVEPGKLPSSVGVLVNNVHTALSAYLAVTQGQPLYRRIITVSGGGIKTPANVWVYIGTTYNDVIAFCGGENENATVKLLNGGPMMGTSVLNGDVAVTKTTSCILLLTEDEAFTGEPHPCINCGRCAKVCPMKLMPMYIDLYSLAGDYKTAVKYGSKSCIECGCCAYVCPSKRPLVQSIRLAKKNENIKTVKGAN